MKLTEFIKMINPENDRISGYYNKTLGFFIYNYRTKEVFSYRCERDGSLL